MGDEESTFRVQDFRRATTVRARFMARVRNLPGLLWKSRKCIVKSRVLDISNQHYVNLFFRAAYCT